MTTYKIILAGPQGCGKGTQAAMLAERFGIPAYSLGQLLREEIAAQTPMGKEIADVVKRGDLVPASVTHALLKDRLARPNALHGYILDGFPRNHDQFQLFATLDTPTHVLILEVPKAESIRRLSGRLSCKACGKVYRMDDGHGHHVGEACACGNGTLFQREDDHTEVIEKRLAIYEEETKEVVESYQKNGIVYHVDGMGSVEEVHSRLLDVLKADHDGCEHTEA